MITHNNELKGDKYLLSVSGGKDSTAMILYMKECLIDPKIIDYVFIDTGWEDVETYSYLDYLESELDIKINRIRRHVQIKEEHQDIYSQCLKILNRDYSDFLAMALNKGMFASGRFKYCTIELKINPFQSYINEIEYEPVSCVGIRREESHKRSTYSEWEYNAGFDVWVYRPIIDFTERQVIDIHARHNIAPNPLYLRGSHRVGCYPCINSNKKELLHFPKDHAHYQVIKLLEEYISLTRGKEVTFFKHRTIDQILEWAKTSHGGKQYFLFNTESPTCEKWGMCGI